ncbi:DUF349 domain-containing protein [Brachybacterium paraconglomeratum]|uniref:DUF349 domain-containing protein n=1 Tax=Brachybacterium paraconglomeratum TaxID=173362 RepID=UPI003FD69AF4
MSESETSLPADQAAAQPADAVVDATAEQTSAEPSTLEAQTAATEQATAEQSTAEQSTAAEQVDPVAAAETADPAVGAEQGVEAEQRTATEESASTGGSSAADTTTSDDATPADDAAPAAGADSSAATTPVTPAPTPAPKPAPGAPRPRPTAPSPAALAGKKPTAALLPVAPAAAEHDPAEIAAAKAFGSVAEDGTVTVQDGTQVRTIGTTTETDHDAALEPFAKGYLDLVAFLDQTASALTAPEHTQNELNRLLENLRKNMKEPQVVGDIPALRARASELREQAKEKIRALEAKRAEGREAATRRRTEFVESIEALVATDPEQISWKNAGETMRQMVPTWKQMQSEDIGLDRPTEEALWKRLSAARASFDRMRKQFFSQLDERHAEAAAQKEELIARAEAMQDSTDWGPTVRAYKDLMDQWRRAPRGSRKKDDAQWKRFKAAQDTFFAARNADLHETEAEQRKNLEVKEALLVEAEALDPGKDLDAAKSALRSIQDRWEEAGKVPRGDMRRIDDRLRAVERSVKDAEQAEWRRTDPRTKARVEGASSQLHSAIASYEEALEKARAGGDPKKIAEAEAALEARKEWLAVIERSARDLG